MRRVDILFLTHSGRLKHQFISASLRLCCADQFFHAATFDFHANGSAADE